MKRAVVSKRVVELVFVLAATSALVFAQLPTATLLGVVRDSTGAAIPGAALTARNVDTGQTRTTMSDSDGAYRLPALAVGNYELRVEHAGFQTEVRNGLTLSVEQEAVVNFALQVGAVQQTIAVTAEAPLVNTSGSSLGTTIDEQKVADLPLNGRNYVDLMLLQPGVTQQVARSGPGGMYGKPFSSNGASIYSNNFLLDGAIMQIIDGNGSASISDSTLGIEGIREYRVLTNNFSAEYGMVMGSQTLIVSKGGTNAFHGTLFEFLRNNDMDARNFFDYRTASTPYRLPPLKRNNFGGSFGGPIKKDKTFFFGTYEELNQRQGITTVSTTLPPAAHVNGGIPGVTISPLIQPLLSLFPLPNLPASNQFTFPFTEPTTEEFGQMRVDQNFSPADAAFVRSTVDADDQNTPLAYPQFAVERLSRNQYHTLSENHVFSPTLLNTARISYSRTSYMQISETTPAPYIGPQYSFVPGREMGTLAIGGATSLGSSSTAPSHKTQNIFTYSDDVYYTIGRHALKFGAMVNAYQWFMWVTVSEKGTLTFANVNSFLQAQPSQVVAVTPGSFDQRTYHFKTMGFYAQDDFKATSRLTLNLGLRYEPTTTFSENHNEGVSIPNILQGPVVGAPFKNPSLLNLDPRFGFAWDVRGDGETAVRGGFGVLNDLGSNFGGLIAQDLCSPPFCSTSTVLLNSSVLSGFPIVFPASAAGKTLQGLNYDLRQPHMLSYNLTVERQLPWNIALTAAYAGSRGINLMEYTEGNPTFPTILASGQKFWTGTEPRLNTNWGTYEEHTSSGNSWYSAGQFGLIKRVTRGLQFQSAYTYSKCLDENSQQQSAANSNFTVSPDPLNLKLNKGPCAFDATHNWHLNSIYRLPDLVRGGGLLAGLANGWGISGIFSLESGLPFSVDLQTQVSRSQTNTGRGASSDRPNLAQGISFSSITSGVSSGCGGVAAGTPVGTPNLWYNPCDFTVQPAGFLGTAGRDILRGPSFDNLDIEISKDTPLRFLGEGRMLQFRADIFNLFNHASFLLPEAAGLNNAAVAFSGTAGQTALPTAGVLTSTVNTSRQLQLALKLIF